MTERDLKELLEKVSSLPQDQLKRLRELIDSLVTTRPKPKASLFGSIAKDDADSMNAAIEEAFEPRS